MQDPASFKYTVNKAATAEMRVSKLDCDEQHC